MATLTYSEGLFRILCSVICPQKLSINLWLSLAPKRLLFVATRVKKEQRTVQSILQCQKAAIRELQPILCACARDSVPRV